MWNISTIVLGIAISLAIVHGDSSGDDGSIRLVANSNQIFSRNFFAAVASESSGNVICSPLSAQLTLALARLGANGTTKAELTEKLGLGQNEEENNQAFLALRNEIRSENVDGTVLHIANRMYAATKLSLDNNFRKSAKKIFGAKPSVVDFEDPNTRLRINDWVKSATQDKIKDLIQEGSLGENSQLVLVNALYFKGFWKTTFDPSFTAERKFYLMDNQQEVNTTFMYRKGGYKMRRSYRHLNASVLELPYKGDGLSLVIVMPTPVDIVPPGGYTFRLNPLKWNEESSPVTQSMSLTDLERVMKTQDLGDLLNNTRYVDEVEVYLPKFTMELAIDLQGPLQKMGISEMFGGVADLSGISNVSKLVVSKVAQKSFIEITEEGTEAAAATYAEFTYLSAPMTPPRFEMNRPFLFYVVYRKNLNIPPIVLFSGRYETPPSKP